MKIIAFLFLICITAATLVNTSQALRRIKRSPPTHPNTTKLAQDFVELRTSKKDNEANLKEQEHQKGNAVAAAAPKDFKESDNMPLSNKPSNNNNENNNNAEQHQQQFVTENINNQQHYAPAKQEQRSLHLANSALAYLLQNKVNRKLNGLTGHVALTNGANDKGGNSAKVLLIGGSGGVGKGKAPFRDMRGSIACNAKKIAELSGKNNNENGNSNNGNGNNNDNENGNENGGNDYTNNNNFDNGNNNANNDNNNNVKLNAFENANYNKNNNNYDADAKSATDPDQLQLETATCPAPVQQHQPHLVEQLQELHNSGQGPGNPGHPSQGSVVLTFSGSTKPNPNSNSNSNNMKNFGNQQSKYEPMENVLTLANMLLYKLVDKLNNNSGLNNLQPFRSGGTQVFLTPNVGNTLPIPVATPDAEDFDSIDYLYNNNNPLENSGNNQRATIATVTTSPPVPLSLPLLPPLFFQSQFALHEPTSVAAPQPINNLIENALDKLFMNGGFDTTEDGDGDELELRCPIHHETIKRNGTNGNLKDDIIQVCSCRFFKKKKNTC